MNIADPMSTLSSGYGRLVVDCAGVVSRDVPLRDLSASTGGSDVGAAEDAEFCGIADDKREGGLLRLAAFAASKADQSMSVRGIRGDSPEGRAVGEGGREPAAEGGFEPATLPSRDARSSLPKSALSQPERDGDAGAPLTTDPSREPGRDVP